MAEFKSRYESLMFYVGDEAKRFSGGRYVTDNAADIEELTKLPDVERVDEPEEAANKPARKTSEK